VLAAPPSAIRTVRLLSGLSQAELAHRAGLRRETVSRVERGASPQLRTARALAEALGLDVELLFPREEPHR
jgi:transcriptional regulator with XRE-family HTH domain